MRRAAARFGLAAVAGRLATDAGVTGWAPGAADAAAKTCFRAWLLARGGSTSREVQNIITAIRRFITLNGAARFETIKDSEPGDLVPAAPADTRTILRAGWKWLMEIEGEARWVYGFVPAVFAAEVCQPLAANDREARQKLHAAGLLVGVNQRAGKTRLTMRKRIPGYHQVELLAVSSAVLGGDEESAARAGATVTMEQEDDAAGY